MVSNALTKVQPDEIPLDLVGKPLDLETMGRNRRSKHKLFLQEQFGTGMNGDWAIIAV